MLMLTFREAGGRVEPSIHMGVAAAAGRAVRLMYTGLALCGIAAAVNSRDARAVVSCMRRCLKIHVPGMRIRRK